MYRFFLKSFSFLLGLLVPVLVFSQELAPPAEPAPSIPTAEVTPLNGTLADDDPDNEARKQDEERQRELFGPDAPGNEVDTDVSHLLRFEFTARVQFSLHPATEAQALLLTEPYLQVEYKSNFELPVSLGSHRKEYDTEAQYDVNTWGALARNEFFDCRLEVIIPHMPVHVTTRLRQEKKAAETDDTEEPQLSSLAIALDFGGDLREDWYSFCTDTSGANLNTKGETESYQLQILKMVQPSLKSIFIEEMDILDNNEVKLVVEPTIIDDREIANDITLSGEGRILIQPF